MTATTRCRSRSILRPRTGTTSTSTSSIAMGCSSPPNSGHPAKGTSVERFKLEIENLDERTLKLTWVDFGIDNALALHFFQEGRVRVGPAPEPAGDVDATGHDRELILTFEEPISAEDIEGFLQGGLDTPGDDAA